MYILLYDNVRVKYVNGRLHSYKAYLSFISLSILINSHKVEVPQLYSPGNHQKLFALYRLCIDFSLVEHQHVYMYLLSQMRNLALGNGSQVTCLTCLNLWVRKAIVLVPTVLE